MTLELKDLETFKCKEDELLFISYDEKLDPTATSDVLQDLAGYLTENGIPFIIIPKDEEKFHIELSQMDATQLRRLSDRIQSELQKKSKIILEQAIDYG